MRTIWKFQLPVYGVNRVSMPIDAQIIHVDNQDGKLCVWAEVSFPAPTLEVRLCVVGTGNPLPDPFEGHRWTHVGSAIVDPFVWHVYESKFII